MFNKKTRSARTLTATVFLAAVVALTGSVYAAGKGNRWIALRHRFKPGQRLEYALTITTSGTSIVSAGRGQQEIPATTKTKMNLRYDVVDVDSQGTATVKMTLDEINSDVQSMGQNMNIRIGATGMKMYSGGMLVFDSSQVSGGDELPIGEMLGLASMPEGVQFDDLFRQGVTAILSTIGEMSVPGIEQGGRGNFLGTLQFFEPERLPKRLVRPGDRWSRGLPLPGVDEEKANSYGLTVENIFEGFEDFNDRRCAKITSTSDVDLSGHPDVLQLMPDVKAFKSRGQGTSYLDVDRGLVLKMVGEASQEIQTMQVFGFQGMDKETGSAPQRVEVIASTKIVVEIELKE